MERVALAHLLAARDQEPRTLLVEVFALNFWGFYNGQYVDAYTFIVQGSLFHFGAMGFSTDRIYSGEGQLECKSKGGFGEQEKSFRDTSGRSLQE
ncbi:hypothetical protein Tco_1147401, partial [Tanacetum coccineum]